MLLFNHRRRPLLPHRLHKAILERLRTEAELCDAIGTHLEDDRWRELAAALWLAIAAMARKPG